MASIQNNFDYNSQFSKMDRNQDISYDSDESDQQSIYRIPNNFMPSDEDAEINKTADTAKLNFNNEDDDKVNIQAAKIFSKFYKTQLFRDRKNQSSFLNHKIFERYKKVMRVYQPKPNLYFLPIKVIIDSRNQKPIGLRDDIVENFMDRANVQIPKQRPDEILVKIHNQKQFQNFVIRFNRIILRQHHPYPQLLDQELSLNPLFDFYERNYDHLKFSQTCGIFMYWAYQKKMLSPDYLSESALKIIVIFYYFNMGLKVTNIVNEYINKKRPQLQKITRLYKVNKKLECELQPELFEYSNFSITEKRSFYQEQQRRYSTMLQVLPVPYPVLQQDFEQFCKKNPRNRNDTNTKQVYSVIKFFSLMQYLQNCIKRSQRVIIDFTKDRKGATNRSEIDFNIEIKHPIFGNNICQKLTHDQSKLRLLKQQINNVMSIYRKCSGNPLQTLMKIFDKN